MVAKSYIGYFGPGLNLWLHGSCPVPGLAVSATCLWAIGGGTNTSEFLRFTSSTWIHVARAMEKVLDYMLICKQAFLSPSQTCSVLEWQVVSDKCQYLPPVSSATFYSPPTFSTLLDQDPYYHQSRQTIHWHQAAHCYQRWPQKIFKNTFIMLPSLLNIEHQHMPTIFFV